LGAVVVRQLALKVDALTDRCIGLKIQVIVVKCCTGASSSWWIKSKFVCKFPQLERADYIIRVTFDTGFG
jgi:hypothetical protein